MKYTKHEINKHSQHEISHVNITTMKCGEENKRTLFFSSFIILRRNDLNKNTDICNVMLNSLISCGKNVTPEVLTVC